MLSLLLQHPGISQGSAVSENTALHVFVLLVEVNRERGSTGRHGCRHDCGFALCFLLVLRWDLPLLLILGTVVYASVKVAIVKHGSVAGEETQQCHVEL